MFRWINCCCLVLGITALGWAGSEPGASADRGARLDEPVFGLQVHVGLDGSMRSPPQPRSKPGQASLAGYTDDHPETSDAGRLNLVDWQEESGEIFEAGPANCDGGYGWQVMPVGLMYKAYLAGEKESRMQAVWLSSKGRNGLIWETTLGGHVGLLRHGTTDAVNPEGWQLDLEGAALPRVDLANNDDLEACDFRAGFLSTWRHGPNAFKAGYYHLSSHLGDEYLIRNPGYLRLNYVRDSGIVGWTRHLNPNAQIYGEVAYAFNAEDGALPLELQYGAQYSPLKFGLRGAPFAAINGHTRQDFGYVTSVNMNAGWQWRGASNHTYRLGMQYYTGPALQYSFAGLRETLFGGGMWMDY